MSDIKELLIDQTIALIKESDGKPESITARAIAQRSGVALGLINYHFGSKDNLLAECSNKIITDLLCSMKPELMNAEDDGLSDRERLTGYAKQTFEFLFANRAIVKMSILSDFRSYRADSNSALTQKGFQMALRGNIPDKSKRLISFSLAYPSALRHRCRLLSSRQKSPKRLQAMILIPEKAAVLLSKTRSICSWEI